MALFGVVALGLWVSLSGTPRMNWVATSGTILDVRLYTPAYTALAAEHLVRVNYQYIVDGVRYGSTWEGDWPHEPGPNGLRGDDVERIVAPGYPLLVWYDRDSPSRSRLHGKYGGLPVVWQRLLVMVLIVFWGGLVIIYPRMKRRSRT